MQPIPVVFIHRLNMHMEAVVRCAQKRNSRVILLGDHHNLGTRAEHHRFKHYSEEARKFAKVYKHMHTRRDAPYEMFCFTRWYYLKDFMQTQQLERVFVGDSDLLIYTDLTTIADDWGNYDILLNIPSRQPRYRWAASAHATFLTYKGLADFCDYTLDMYSSKACLQQLNQKWEWHKSSRTPGGVCDMTLFYLFQQLHPERVGNLLSVVGTPPHAFDLNFSLAENHYPDEYEIVPTSAISSGTTKRLIWKNKQPYGFNVRTQQQVRFDALHLQGGASKIISHYVTQ